LTNKRIPKSKLEGLGFELFWFTPNLYTTVYLINSSFNSNKIFRKQNCTIRINSDSQNL